MVAATLRYGVRGGCAAALSRYRGYRGDRICRGAQHSDMVAAAVTALCRGVRQL